MTRLSVPGSSCSRVKRRDVCTLGGDWVGSDPLKHDSYDGPQLTKGRGTEDLPNFFTSSLSVETKKIFPSAQYCSILFRGGGRFSVRQNTVARETESSTPKARG